MIEVENLAKTYGGFTAVNGISFKVAKGEILGFLGPNGAGKSTTMRILTCFLPPTSGRATVAGYDCFSQPLEVKRRVGYLPESAPLYRDMRVGEYLDFAAAVKGLRGAAKKEQVAEVMRETGIADMGRGMIAKLSKGYRQRVGLAQALLNNPEVLVLDEPTAGLDPKQIVEIRQLIKGMSGKRTVILSTHILPEVSIVCDRVVIIHKGRVVAVDTPKNLAESHQKKGTVRLVLDAPPGEATELLSKIYGVNAVAAEESAKPGEIPFSLETAPQCDPRREIAATVVGRGWGLLEMSQKQVSLEDIFVDLVTEEKPGDAPQKGDANA